MEIEIILQDAYCHYLYHLYNKQALQYKLRINSSHTIDKTLFTVCEDFKHILFYLFCYLFYYTSRTGLKRYYPKNRAGGETKNKYKYSKLYEIPSKWVAKRNMRPAPLKGCPSTQKLSTNTHPSDGKTPQTYLLFELCKCPSDSICTKDV